jgi:hypothetical protein
MPQATEGRNGEDEREDLFGEKKGKLTYFNKEDLFN